MIITKRIEIGWCYITIDSKPYISPYGIKAYMCRSISISKRNKEDKKFGYFNFYYDGYFHSFSLYFLTVHWFYRPIPIK